MFKKNTDYFSHIAPTACNIYLWDHQWKLKKQITNFLQQIGYMIEQNWLK